VITKLDPAWAKCRAQASPMPEDAPVLLRSRYTVLMTNDSALVYGLSRNEKYNRGSLHKNVLALEAATHVVVERL